MTKASDGVVVLALMVVAAGVFVAGIDWGLPSRAVDPFLFGSHPVWSGEEIVRLAGGFADDAKHGADVDLNPILGRDRVVLLNGTDRERAEIVRRYRLFTYQPDEWNTMRSLAGMRPGEGKLDPKLYQYGGLWVYPVGALLKVASKVGFVHLTSDLAYYLDRPEEFGRFYVVARLYSAAWGVAGVFAVWWIARRLSGGSALAAAGAGACYCFLPVVVNMAHEAKPHLAGAVLMLYAVAAAGKYVETGRRRWWVGAGVLCGGAFGMVLSALPIFSVLAVMVVLRREAWRRRVGIAAAAGAIGVIVYFAVNPYVAINFFGNREVLASNLGTSTAMYEVTGRGAAWWNAVRLMAEGASTAVMVAGILGTIVLVRRGAGGGFGWLLAAPAGLVTVYLCLLAGGKPGEYGRFGLLPDVALAIAGVSGIAVMVRDVRLATALTAVLGVVVAVSASRYLVCFWFDRTSSNLRMVQARRLAEILDGRAELRMGVFAEPAPYCLPPVDLFRWKLLLLPRGYVLKLGEAPGDVIVRAVDMAESVEVEGYVQLEAGGLSRVAEWQPQITWAAKPFQIHVRRELLEPSAGDSAGPATRTLSETPPRR